jgi:hypothetical protein
VKKKSALNAYSISSKIDEQSAKVMREGRKKKGESAALLLTRRDSHNMGHAIS